MTSEPEQPVATSSTAPLGQGATSYHDTSQYRNWRWSSDQLRDVRQLLSSKAQQILAKNIELEKEAQISLGHAFTDPPPPTTYLSVDEELLLVRFYCDQASKIVQTGFNLPESVVTTAVSYVKRFYLKNSVMEYHPKIIMPTCVFLAAKTTNYPISMDVFRERFAKLDPEDILSTEFLVAQSLMFEFWIRGPEKSLRGWALDIQSCPDIKKKQIQSAVVKALEQVAASRLTDLEFTHSPSQIGLASLRLVDKDLVDSFLDWKYGKWDAEAEGGELYGISQQRLTEILTEIEGTIRRGAEPIDMKQVKGIDKRLKSCTNPEKVPGTALYIKRKQEQESAAAAVQAEKALKRKQQMDDDHMVFGDVIQPIAKIKKDNKPSSPRVSLGGDRALNDTLPTGMGLKDEAMGLLEGGQGLKALGQMDDDV